MAESGDVNRMEEARAQVGEVVDVMRVNVEKVLERDSKLSDLNTRADTLQAGANQFQTQVGFIFISIVSRKAEKIENIEMYYPGYKTQEKILVAEYEDDDDNWGCCSYHPHHHHCISYKRWQWRVRRGEIGFPKFELFTLIFRSDDSN